jgi:hypothetical protein
VIDEANDPPLPTRVVDVGPPDGLQKPQLLESRGLSGQYFALSHCWGPPENHPLMTTKSNLSAHISGISLEALPKVYRDAIVATRKQGVQYLWIDSLCIIQDDHDDWLSESKKMAEVYERARMVIAASHAEDTTEGCFMSRPEPPVAVEIPYRNAAGAHIGSVFASVMDTDYIGISPEFGALNQRAWATQEWLLARRMVFYTRRCIAWSCKVITLRETGASFHTTARNTKWKFIVEKYSTRSLTKATDRLIALEGVRSSLQKRLDDTYLLGLWKSALPDQLLWYSGRNGERSRCRLNVPTWTWASTMHEIRFFRINKAKNTTQQIKYEEPMTLIIKSRLRQATLRSCSLDDVRFQDSAIPQERLKAFETEVSWGSPHVNIRALYSEKDDIIGLAAIDDANAEMASLCFCLSLMSRTYVSESKPEEDESSPRPEKLQEDFVLLIAPCNGSSESFVRIGIARVFLSSWFVAQHAKQVRIV